MTNPSDALLSISRLAIGIVDSLGFLWMHRGGDLQDLERRDIVAHFGYLGRACRAYLQNRTEFDAGLECFARVSRQPVASLYAQGLSTTEHVFQLCTAFVQSFERSVRIQLQRDADFTDAEKAVLSSILPTYARCLEWKAEIEWECQRAIHTFAAPARGQDATGLSPGSPELPTQAAKPPAIPPIEIFYSYSHADRKLRASLEKHLSQLKHEGVIAEWHDRKIGAGHEWEGQIDQHLNAARIILLLVSSDFLASRYCYDVEMKRAMERHQAGEARVIPIILRPCDWHSAPFGKLQALPTEGCPVPKWKNRDEAFTDVARGIRAAVAELTARS